MFSKKESLWKTCELICDDFLCSQCCDEEGKAGVCDWKVWSAVEQRVRRSDKVRCDRTAVDIQTTGSHGVVTTTGTSVRHMG